MPPAFLAPFPPRSYAEGGPSNMSQRAARSPRGAVIVFTLRVSRRLFRPPSGGWNWNPFPVSVSDRPWISGICPGPAPV